MAYRVELTGRAARDLEYLFVTINTAESLPAALWYNGLEGAIFSLEKLPLRCSLAPESKKFGRTLRHLLYGKRPRVYRVIFEVVESGKTVLIRTIRHWAMDQARPEDLA